MRNITRELSKIYQPLSMSGRRTYDYQFLKLVTSSQDLMTYDIYDSIFDIVKYQVQRLNSASFEVNQNDDASNSLVIVSNLVEYLNNELLKMNMTQAWSKLADPQSF